MAVLGRFLCVFLEGMPVLCAAQRRAIWALSHCRTAAMGGHLHGCPKCRKFAFAYHSCNHRACPQCGRSDTSAWVERELDKRIGAPYFMVTFTLPQELRPLFFTASAKPVYDLFFNAASEALADTLSNPRWLGAQTSGFTMILHTWNQRLLFHPHLHCIVPGAGLDATGRVVVVKSPGFLVPQPVLRKAFRESFRRGLAALVASQPKESLPIIDPDVWNRDWGVHLQPFGDGACAIKYLGAYVCRTAIGDARILAITEESVTFRWKDRAQNDAPRTETIAGVEFVVRYLRHVLPRGLRAIRRYGFYHPAAKAKRERVALYTGRPLWLGTPSPPPAKPPVSLPCPCCGGPMPRVLRVLSSWAARAASRAPPTKP